MKNIVISTENTCDLTAEMLSERQIETISMKFFLDGEEVLGDKFDSKDFYKRMRGGANTKTSMLNEYEAEIYFYQLLAEGKDIVHISFTSQCSGSCKNLQNIAEKLNKINKNKIYVIDSLCASGGQGLLVTLVDDFARSGKTAQEVAEFAEEQKHHICHYFCVESVKYLARGGRISKAAALIGSLINIKPVLYCDKNGNLSSYQKELTRKRALSKLVKIMGEKFDKKCQRIFVCGADCDDDMNFVANLIETEFQLKPQTMPLGPVIGSHSGPGTVAIFFTGKER